MVAGVCKVCDGCTTIKTSIKKQAIIGHGQKAQDHGWATNFLQQVEWRLRWKGCQHCRQANYYVQQAPSISANKGMRHCWQAELFYRKPSGLSQQGHETLRASCVASPSGLSHQGHETWQASFTGGSSAEELQWDSSRYGAWVGGTTTCNTSHFRSFYVLFEYDTFEAIRIKWKVIWDSLLNNSMLY
jgi:hypothetical protein